MEKTVGKDRAVVDPGSSVQCLPGVGHRRAELLARVGVATVQDALYLLPRRYLDATRVLPISLIAAPAKEITVAGKVTGARFMFSRGRKIGFEATLADNSGMIVCRWFGRTFLSGQIQKGQRWIVHGETRLFRGKLYLNPLEYEPLEQETRAGPGGTLGPSGGVIPIYPLTEGLAQSTVRRILHSALACADQIQDILPLALRSACNLMTRAEAFRRVHAPKSVEQARQARRSLAFEEFFYLELMLLARKLHIQSEKRARTYRRHNHLIRRLGQALPFTLTEAQKRVLRRIDDDLCSPHPMNRLVQGDVGSGKTVVAALAALRAVENGYQAALMAPTEILAEQHHRSLRRLLEPLDLQPVCLVGGMPPADKQRALEALASGAARIAVGTHALIQERVRFRELGLAIIDEQHRFGVNQRLQLKKKGRHTDCLVMTATPIPRSLALTLYGDLDISVIDQMPAGRKKISTHLVPEHKRKDMEDFMAGRIKEGEQVFVVCPRIDQTEQSEQAAAEQWFQRYRDEIFPGFEVVLVHGRMPAVEREKSMQAFEQGKAQVLVGTTVIEVGIDVPSATVIVIEGAERFGLSQLHQLRGRVGRSDKQSWCLLIPSPGTSGEPAERLSILERTGDGFEISEQDLRLRGPGDFFGERQSGLPELRVADILDDYPLLLEAREAAETLLLKDPFLRHPEHASLRRELIVRYRDRIAFLQAG